MEDHEVAGLLAGEAGDLLLEIRDRAMAEGWSPNRLRDEGDRQAHRLLTDRLNGLRPHDALLSEEGQDDGARVDADYIRESILDPAAGTSEGFEEVVDAMPPIFGNQLTASQLEAVVQFLVSQR